MKIFPENFNWQNIKVDDLIEIILQLDVDMYQYLPEKWQNPGIANFVAISLIADEVRPHLHECNPAIVQFIQEIDMESNKALKELQEKGQMAFIKPMMNKILETKLGTGFNKQYYSHEELKPIIEQTKLLPREGQFIYRPSDGRFFLLMPQSYIDIAFNYYSKAKEQNELTHPKIVRDQSIKANKLPQNSLTGVAHVTGNERMDRNVSEKIFEHCKEVYGLVPIKKELLPPDGLPGLVGLNLMMKVAVAGAYKGDPRTYSLYRSLHVISVQTEFHQFIEGLVNELKAMNKIPVTTTYEGPPPHITFGISVRKPHTALKQVMMGKISDHLNDKGLTADLRRILKSDEINSPSVAFKSLIKHDKAWLQFAEIKDKTIQEIGELVSQLDVDMYKHLPENLKEPGIAGLCAFRLLADVLEEHHRILNQEQINLLEKINKVTAIALDMLNIQGKNAHIKPLIIELYDQMSGFRRTEYSPSDFALIKKIIENIPTKGQLVFREADGHAVIAIDPIYIDNLFTAISGQLITKQYSLQKSNAEHLGGIAHITLTDNVDSKRKKEIMSQCLAKYNQIEPYYGKAVPGLIYLDFSVEFRINSAYFGYPTSSPWLAEVHVLDVDILNISELEAQGIKHNRSSSYQYHITFAERIRQPYPRFVSADKVLDLLTHNPLNVRFKNWMISQLTSPIESETINHNKQYFLGKLTFFNGFCNRVAGYLPALPALNLLGTDTVPVQQTNAAREVRRGNVNIDYTLLTFLAAGSFLVCAALIAYFYRSSEPNERPNLTRR